MRLFKGLQIALDLGYDLKFTKKIEVKKKILENGGIISYIITRKCHLLITNDPEKCTSSLKSRMAIKYGLPVLKLDYIWDSLQASSLLPYDSYVVGGKSKILDFRNGKISASVQKEKLKKFSSQTFFNPRAVKVWTAADSHQPWQYEENHEVAKYAVFKGHNYVLKCQTMTIIELHTPPARLHMMNSSEMVVDKGNKETHFNYRVVFQTGNTKDLEVGKPCHTETRYVVTAEQALAVFAMLHEDTERKTDMIKWTGPVRALGSIKFQKLMAGMVDVHSGCPEPVKELVEHVWGEAMAEVTFLLGDISAIKIDQVEKAEAILLKARDAIKLSSSENIIQDLINKFYSTLPHRHEASVVDINERKRWLAKKQDMCQLIRDMISVSEMTDYETRACIEAKYAALRCRITHLTGSQKDEIEDLVQSTLEGPSQDLRILNVYEVWRQAEDLDFSHDLDGKQLLFHSSTVENFVGILSRGLLLPKVVVDDFGGKRSDAGNLGSGIYFASSASKSVKYSSPSKIKGSRLLLINEVALGRSKDYTCHDSTLVAPPDGYNSTHGVSRKSEKSSEFEYDEFVVYAVNQQRVRYLVEFTVKGDVIKPVEIIHMSDNNMQYDAVETATISDVVGLGDPLSKIKAGLTGKGDLEVKLCGVHIRAKLIDLAAQVVVLQEYCNNSQQAIEAKYMFPLEDTATVCGFEAFINGKHIVGEVKEKEIAHKEYKKAISEGHGAYLMDQDVEIPDVFTVSVGNLPAGANVLIKITYVAELQMEGEHISFSLPAAVAPWKENAALKQSTQDELKSHKMTLSKTTVQVAVEMPCEIRKLHCPTHKIRVKQTASKAYVEMMNHQIFGAGFQLLISLAEIHVPRMWVERHPVNTNHRACMLTFYPEFESEEVTNGEVMIILDASNSMKGSAMIEAKKVALLILQNVPSGWHFNVVRFGSEYEELFAAPKIKKEDNIQLAISFVQNSVANKGNTDFMKPLHSLFLLPRSEGQRNVFLISDGHINSDEHVLHHANQNSVHTRVFSFGVSATCNSYFLKALSRVSGGAFEFFNIKTKSKWEPKVKSQISKACQPGLTSVAVEWQQYDDNVPLPVQAPRQITALFNGSRQVVYGFVSNCTMATLKAKVEGQEVSTVVSTSDLSVTEGLLVHRLTARAVIRDWEDGILSSDRTQHEMAKMDLKSYIIDLSKKYSIVTQFTSFIAVEKREENEKDLPKSGPSVEELVDKENVDILSYMGWTTLPEDDNITVMTMINKLSQAVRQQELSNKVLYEMEAIEDKYRELREQAGPLNDDVLNVALVLMDVYCQIGEIDKAVNTAEIAYKEAVSQAFRMVEDPDYPKLADMLLDLRNRALSIKKNVDVVLSDPIPLPKNADGKVIIQFLTGSQLTISCRDTLTFGHLNELIRTREGIPINDLRLIYNGWKFDDSTLLGDVKVGHGDSIYAIKMLRGGGGVNLCESDEGSSGIVASKEVEEEEKDDDMGYGLDGDNSIEESVVGSSDTVASKKVEEEEEDDDMGFGLFDGDDAVGVSREKETSASLKIDEPLPAETVHVLGTSGKTYDQSATRFLKAVELPQPMYSPTSPSYQSISMSQAPPPPPTVSLDVDSLQATRAADLPQPVYNLKSPAYHHYSMYSHILPAYQSISMSQAPPPPPPPPPPVTFSLDQSVEKEKAERLQHLYKATDQLAPIFDSLQAPEAGILPPPRKCRDPCINLLERTPPPLPPRQNLLGHSVGMSGQLQRSTALCSASPSQALSQSPTLFKSMRADSAASFDQQSVSETPHVSFGMPPSTSSPRPSLSSSEWHKVRDKELSADFAKASVALYNKVVDTESPIDLSEAPKTSSGSISSHAQLPLLTKEMHMVQHRPMKMAKISVFPTELGHTQSSEGQTGESEDLKCQSSLLPVLDVERFCKMNLFKRRYMLGKARTSDAIPQSHEPPARMQTTPLQASSGISCIRTNKDALQLKDLVKLIKYQTEVGSWELKSNLDDLLGINSNQCLNILMSSGLGSLGKSTAEDIKQLVATLLVLFSIMELLIPEYFPIGGSSARELPASGICFEKIAFDTLVLSDHSHMFLRVVTAIRKAFKFCVKMEQQHPVVYSTLELGTSWLNVTTTFMQSHVE